MNLVYAAFIGLAGGVAGGLFGIGGGIVMVPAMIFLLKMDPKAAIGTSLAVIIPTAVVGAFKHFDLGNLQWRIALMLMPTAIAGGYLGAWLTSRVPEIGLKRAFGCLMLIVAVKLLFGK